VAVPTGWSAFYRIVRRVPRGRVTTYGQVALLAGKPRAARQVGYALAALRGTRHDVPWQRVLGARSRGHAAISILDPVGAAVQRAMLEREGVRFDERGRVPLDRFGWRRAASARRRGAGPGARSVEGARLPRRSRRSRGRSH
jgi:methylated-DNA-protein-cysteine methyltransferase-like protein